MTPNATLPAPLTDDELDAAIPSLWSELEFADWRARGAWDPLHATTGLTEQPVECAEFESWLQSVDSLDFAELLAGIDWSAADAPGALRHAQFGA